MIRNDETLVSTTRTSTYLLRRILADVEVDSERLRNIALGMESFFETLPAGVAFSDESLTCLAAQALAACGEDAAAAQLVRDHVPAEAQNAVLELLRHRCGFSPAAWRLFCTGTVSIANCDFEGGREIWILDFNRLAVTEDHCFELSWVPALSHLLDEVVRLWARNGSPTTLAIRGLGRFSSCLGEAGSFARGTARMVGICEVMLAAAVRRYGGHPIPRVVVMDHYPRKRTQRAKRKFSPLN